MCKFRNLNPDEVELRVAQAGSKAGRAWAQYLIYKDARVDQRILDDTVGPEYWQKSYEFLDGKLYCTISIWNKELKAWVSKQDVGTESNTEPEKGMASDAQKRAATVWGIGRELYTAPQIFVSLAEGEYDVRGDKVYPKNGLFTVSAMDVDENKKITRLVITDRNGAVRFSWPNKPVSRTSKPAAKTADNRKHPTENQIMALARRIAAGEDLTDKIQVNFLMSQQEWMWLDAEVKKINFNNNLK